MSLRCGITTGTCAAAAAKAAARVLVGGAPPDAVEVRLPDGRSARVPILNARRTADGTAATAAVRKDAGDDPDVTHGLEVWATVVRRQGRDVQLVAGEGVGTVTKPGLQVPPGQPAINPVPRQMIAAAVREVTDEGLCVVIAIPGGRAVAPQTFNPRLGIEGGLSILGTTGIVRPYCAKALHDALRCALDVAVACGTRAIVFVPGNIGAKAARSCFSLKEEQVIEAGNAWGFLLDQLAGRDFDALMILGHPGKLAKLAAGQWDTHSSRSAPATEVLRRLCPEVLGHAAPESPTVEGMFTALPAAERKTLADALAGRVRQAVASRLDSSRHTDHAGMLPGVRSYLGGRHTECACYLVDMAGRPLGADGDFSPWR